MRGEFFMAMNIQVVVFRAMNMLLFGHVHGDSIFLRIVGIHLQDTTQKKSTKFQGLLEQSTVKKFMQRGTLKFVLFS